MSGTKNELHGAAHGKGVYFGKNTDISLAYGASGKPWPKSQFKNTPKVVLVADVIKDSSCHDASW
jgi:hypothetical protein